MGKILFYREAILAGEPAVVRKTVLARNEAIRSRANTCGRFCGGVIALFLARTRITGRFGLFERYYLATIQPLRKRK